MIQIDMEMPETCRDCPFWQGPYGCHIVEGIPAWQNEIAEEGQYRRSEHCPLKEVNKEIQKSVIPKKAPFPDASRANGSWIYVCGLCYHPIDFRDKYCRECATPIDWTTS